jgi:serine/threonine protein kinase
MQRGIDIVKIADFGSSREAHQTLLKNVYGTKIYLSPEQKRLCNDNENFKKVSGGFNFKTDVYSLGLIIC